jgi:hypothetical protein
MAMDTNQLLSTIRYMISQRTALVDMEDALQKVVHAEEIVAQATKEEVAIRAQIVQEQADAAQAQMVAQAKLDAFQGKLEALQAAIQETTQLHQARTQELHDLTQTHVAKVEEVTAATKVLSEQHSQVKQQVADALLELDTIKVEAKKRQAILDQLKGV